MDKLKEVTIYTDGCCIKNPGPGGHTTILCYNKHEKELSGGFRLTTSNRMELMAAIIGLDALKEPCSVMLYTRSKYLVKSMTKNWVYRWKSIGLSNNEKKEIIDIDLWEILLGLSNYHTVKFIYVKAYDGYQYGERCSISARNESTKENLSIDVEYEKLSETINEGKQNSQIDKLFQEKSNPKPEINMKMPKNKRTGKKQIYQVELDGKIFIWNTQTWFGKENSIVPPKAIIHMLNSLLEDILEREDDNISDLNQLLKRAREARDSLQYRRGQKLARRVISIVPSHLGALSVLCSCLRSSGHAQQAIDETDGFDSSRYSPLLTSRASALCDLERWEEAKELISRAFAIGIGSDSKAIASSVIDRIKNMRPDLYNIDDRRKRR